MIKFENRTLFAQKANSQILHDYFNTVNTRMKEAVKAAQRLKVTP